MPRLREPMSAADAAWLQMDSPDNRLIITSLLTFDGPPDPAELDRILQRLAAQPRFHQRVVPPRTPLGLPAFEDDPLFDLRAHVHAVGLPAPGGEEELQQFVSERMNAALDPERPLWEIDLIDRGANGSALLMRLHHCIGDGVALVRLLLGLTGEHAAAPARVGHAPRRTKGLLDWARGQFRRAAALARLLALPADPPTPLRVPLGVVKRAAWSAPIPLAAVRAVAGRYDATVNDVLMAALTGALRGWLVARRGLPAGGEIRALVPVYVGERRAAMEGNRFGLAFVKLPVSEPDPAARVRSFKRRMDRIKATPEATVAFDVLRLLGAAGIPVERIGVEIFARKTSVMVTNVPGPRREVRVAGRRVTGMMTWAPTSGRMGIAVTLLSYAGELRMGIATDAHVMQRPQELVEAFEHELEQAVGEAQPTRPAGSKRVRHAAAGHAEHP